MTEESKIIPEIEKVELKRRLGPIIFKVGMITFFTGLVSILIGLLIDRANDTIPFFTLAILIISIPLVLLLNVRILRREIGKVAKTTENKIPQE